MYDNCQIQGLSVPFPCIGSGDPVRVLHLYTTNTLDILLKHLLLRHMYNLPLPMLICYVLVVNTYRLRCQDDIFSRIELFPSNVLSSEKAHYKNDIQ